MWRPCILNGREETVRFRHYRRTCGRQPRQSAQDTGTGERSAARERYSWAPVVEGVSSWPRDIGPPSYQASSAVVFLQSTAVSLLPRCAAPCSRRAIPAFRKLPARLGFSL